MNIKEAKQEIANALRAYHRKDQQGAYLYPTVRQRPLLLMGPPGIGKTAILEQVAREQDVGLVAYTMTHHTRQSAIGLPRIRQKTYDGREYSVTEYTMSEIVAAVYDCMECTGKTEGILFLDEINCVSETLAPTMLQLLQNKTFGSHKLPEGWLIVAAGNPPAYNKSVREFDMATLDRVRVIDVDADCSVWTEYACQHQIHTAILSYLAIRPQDFYVLEDTADGKFFVTARGWEDLSQLLQSYEALELPVAKGQVRQYLQKDAIAGQFAAYYQLYRKYRTDYAIPQLLDGTLDQDAYTSKTVMAKNGGFEERFTVVHLLLDALDTQFTAYGRQYRRISQLHQALQQIKTFDGSLDVFLENRRKAMEVKAHSELLSSRDRETACWVTETLEHYSQILKQAHHWDSTADFDLLRTLFRQETSDLDAAIDRLHSQLDRAFRFAEDCFGDGQELVLLVSGLARSSRAMDFIRTNGCDAFLRHSHILLYRSQERALRQECEKLFL